ncbi:MAG: hypothetical protein ACRDBO_16850 [Lachnospiraceae bacterium]
MGANESYFGWACSISEKTMGNTFKYVNKTTVPDPVPVERKVGTATVSFKAAVPTLFHWN